MSDSNNRSLGTSVIRWHANELSHHGWIINYKIWRKIIPIIRSEIHWGIESLLIQPFYWGYFSMMQCDVVQNCTWQQPQHVYLVLCISTRVLRTPFAGQNRLSDAKTTFSVTNGKK